MSLTAKVLFDVPQQEIASLIAARMNQSTSTSIVTGFATPGGLGAISAAFKAQPTRLNTMVIGAATYPGFRALDDLLAVGVPRNRLLVHLGHSCKTNTKKHPFARYHPMLHSKVYYMELPGDLACCLIGSHNLTSFALMGLNGEASVMLEGPKNSPEFNSIRSHIQTARSQATRYSSDMKDAYAWWMREFLDGLRTEIEVPQDWQEFEPFYCSPAQWATCSFEAAGDRGYRYGYAAKRAVASYLGSGGLLTTRADSDQDKD